MNKYLAWKPFLKFMAGSAVAYVLVSTAMSIGYAQCKMDMTGKDATTPKVN